MSSKNDDINIRRNQSIVTNGVLLLSFAITLFTQANITQAQKNIAYAALFLSVILAICSLLPRNIRFLSNNWFNGLVGMFAYLAWFFNFAMKWLDGLKNTSDVEQFIISILGSIWLFCILMILTRLFTVVTEQRGRPLRWFSFILPLVLLWQTILVFTQGNWQSGLILLVFVVGSTFISLRIWKPVGTFSFGG
jgi:hypothetical protein